MTAQVDRSPQGGDGEAGSIADESAVAEGHAPRKLILWTLFLLFILSISMGFASVKGWLG